MGSWSGHDKSGRASQRWQPGDWSVEGMQAFSGGVGSCGEKVGEGEDFEVEGRKEFQEGKEKRGGR